MYRALLKLNSQAEYLARFIEEYIHQEIATYSGKRVRFSQKDFYHAFFQSSTHYSQDKANFSTERAERMLWIKEALNDRSLEVHKGWNKSTKSYDDDRRVTLVSPDKYIVVLALNRTQTAYIFITAYVIDKQYNLNKILESPKSNL